jgi:hypothetical protein
MSVRRSACHAYKQSVLEQARADYKAAAAERLRHYDGARAHMEKMLNLSDAGPGSGWGLASFVEHERRVSRYVSGPFRGRTRYDTVTQRAVEFLVEGLTFRVTEHRPQREHMGSVRYLRTDEWGRLKQAYPDYGYTVYVHLPESEKPWYRWGRKPRWYWQQISTREVLGALLLKRGMCGP